jgi:hypothetical protein
MHGAGRAELRCAGARSASSDGLAGEANFLFLVMPAGQSFGRSARRALGLRKGRKNLVF